MMRPHKQVKADDNADNDADDRDETKLMFFEIVKHMDIQVCIDSGLVEEEEWCFHYAVWKVCSSGFAKRVARIH